MTLFAKKKPNDAAPEWDAMDHITQFPHCDSRVLHAPGVCEYCDGLPDWQALREVWGINYTGGTDPDKERCPAEKVRDLWTIEHWSGNTPNGDPPTPRERTQAVVFPRGPAT